MNFSNPIDISPLISPETAVFPGDQAFSSTEVFSTKKGDHLSLSHITTTVHIGAHTDAPNHYSKDGESIESRNLKYYLGPCQVIDVSRSLSSNLITLESLKNNPIEQQRVLFKTETFADPNQWTNDFAAFSPEVIDHLHTNGVITVGIDTPSIDPATSKTLCSHNRVAKHNMAILEGVVLSKVKPGAYNLIALPLPIVGADASPVRAILTQL